MSEAVSVVIPAFNEEANVEAVYEAIRRACPADVLAEIIFVDDGSTDSTRARVRALRERDPAVRLIRFGRNFGHQAALLAGLEASRGAAVATLDGDLQHPPEYLPKMIEAWRGGAKVVQMVRRQTARTGPFKRLTSRWFYRVLNLVSDTPVVAGAADYQLLDRAVVDAILQFRDQYPFLRGLVAWLGFPSTRLEYDAPARHAGQSSYTTRKMMRLAVEAMASLSPRPMRFAIYLGLATAAFCLLYSVFAVAALLAGETVQGWTSVVVLVTFLGAVQLVSIGVLGEYVARVYQQTRGAPRYLVVERDD
jgi:dolichol-phosphate mannosyltransferase